MSKLTEAPTGIPAPSPQGSCTRTTVRRVEIRTKEALGDPRGASVVAQASRLGITLESARTARVYLVCAEMDDEQFARAIDRLLADPVTETSYIGASAPIDGARISSGYGRRRHPIQIGRAHV